METNLGPHSVESVSQFRYLQNGNTGNNPVIPTERGMGNVTGLQRCVFSHSHQSKVKKVSKVFPEQTELSVHCPPFWFGHSPLGVDKGGQGSETNG